jgi:Na+/glutamate symporter
VRIWMHLFLSAVGMFAGFFAGAVLAALLLELIRDGPRWVVIPVTAVGMVASLLGGIHSAEWLVRRLPARCPVRPATPAAGRARS